MGPGARKFSGPSEAVVSLRDERGFTLIETILSLSILVIMIGLVLTSMRLGQKSWQKGESVVEEAGKEKFVVKRIEADIASMYPYKEKNNGRESYLFAGHENELSFVTVHHSPSPGLPWGGASYVSYSAEDDGLRIREKTIPLATDALNQAQRSIKADSDIKGISFAYLGEKGWSDEWNIEALKRLPMAVRVAIVYRDDKSPLLLTMPVGVTYDPASEYYIKRAGG